MSSLTNSLGNRLCKRLGWAPGAGPEASRAAKRALMMAASWTILIFAVFQALALTGRGFDATLVAYHVLASTVGGFLVLVLVGFALLHILMLLPAHFLMPARPLYKWIVAIGLASATTGITHILLWLLPDYSVRELIPHSVMLPHLLGGLVGWGLIQELLEIGGEG